MVLPGPATPLQAPARVSLTCRLLPCHCDCGAPEVLVGKASRDGQDCLCPLSPDERPRMKQSAQQGRPVPNPLAYQLGTCAHYLPQVWGRLGQEVTRPQVHLLPEGEGPAEDPGNLSPWTEAAVLGGCPALGQCLSFLTKTRRPHFGARRWRLQGPDNRTCPTPRYRRGLRPGSAFRTHPL